jgi:pilus assembly protein CpaB
MKQKNVILMVVAVGCGLVAAFLTSQMSAKGQVEQVEVVVAAKDLPVGTMITRDEIDKLVKTKKVPKDGLPPAVVLNKEELVDKRLSRPVRAEETFNPQDLSKGGVITLPEGYDMVSLQVGVANAAAGFVGPGSRVNVNATLRLGNKTYAFPLLVNMLVVAVDTNTVGSKEGTYPTMNTVSFAVKEKEALLLDLAKSRGCNLALMLRHPSKSTEGDRKYNIDEVIKLLSDEQNPGGIKGASGENIEHGGGTTTPVTPVKPAGPETPVSPVKPVDPGFAPPPSIAVIKVLVAKEDIAPNTDVTADLIKDKFEEKDLPKDFAADALTDFEKAYGKALKNGVAKGQWVTWSMVGLPTPKPSPQDGFIAPKPGQTETPTQPSVVKPVVKKKIHDVAVHTPAGTMIHRYEETANGGWKKVAELTPEQAAREEKTEAPKAPVAGAPN